MLTSSGVNGATIPPIRPIIELEHIIVFRKFVGHISAVKIYKIVNPHDIDALPIIKHNKTITDLSCGTHGVMIVVTPVIIKVINASFRREKRFSSGIAKSTPGISTTATLMKLMYRFSPRIFVDTKLKP